MPKKLTTLDEYRDTTFAAVKNFNQQDFNEALQLLQSMALTNPDNPKIHELLCYIHARLGDAVQAESEYRIVLRLTGRQDLLQTEKKTFEQLAQAAGDIHEREKEFAALMSSPVEFFDKNSLWDELNITKKELCVKKKKSQDMGGFLKTFWGDRDKEISERDWGNQRQDLNPHQWIKRGSLPPPADKPTPYPPRIHCPFNSDRNPSGNPGEHRRNQRVNPETPNHRGKSFRRAPSPWA